MLGSLSHDGISTNLTDSLSSAVSGLMEPARFDTLEDFEHVGRSDLVDGPRTQIGENQSFKCPHRLGVSCRCQPLFLQRQPLARNRFESVASGDLLRLARAARVETLGQVFPSLVALLARQLGARVGIAAKSQHLLPTFVTISKPPQLTAVGIHQHRQAFPISQFVRPGSRLGSLNSFVGEHVGTTP